MQEKKSQFRQPEGRNTHISSTGWTKVIIVQPLDENYIFVHLEDKKCKYFEDFVYSVDEISISIHTFFIFIYRSDEIQFVLFF